MRRLFVYFLLLTAWSGLAQTGLRVGASRTDLYFPSLKDQQIGVVVNPSSRIGSTHLIDTLCRAGYCVARIFAPEHGYRGVEEAGQWVQDDQDALSGAPVVSLYGKKKKPAPEDLEGLGLVIFDMQDVGARFYTYISTLFKVMEACAEQQVPLMILDRPNPNGHYVDGPVLDMQFESFVGVAPLPIVHGCTVGELARLFKAEGWINKPDQLELHIIPCDGYSHSTPYELPVKPSPNLPDSRSVLLYPSLCLFEGTTASVGRGTSTPFQLIGHPEFDCDTFWFVPRPNAGAKSPVHQGWVCKGFDFRAIPLDTLRARKSLDIATLLSFYQRFSNKQQFFLRNGFFDLLAGTDRLRLQLEDGCNEAEIRSSWAADLQAFKDIRRKYLIYPE